jgi:hypothetical protein
LTREAWGWWRHPRLNENEIKYLSRKEFDKRSVRLMEPSMRMSIKYLSKKEFDKRSLRLTEPSKKGGREKREADGAVHVRMRMRMRSSTFQGRVWWEAWGWQSRPHSNENGNEIKYLSRKEFDKRSVRLTEPSTFKWEWEWISSTFRRRSLMREAWGWRSRPRLNENENDIKYLSKKEFDKRSLRLTEPSKKGGREKGEADGAVPLQ